MLSHLDELQENIKNIILNISQLQRQVSTPYQAKKSNLRNSILIKIPKYLLLTKIIPFLTLKQTQNLSNTCVLIRRTIYTPLGWKSLIQNYSPYDIIIVPPQTIKKISFRKQLSFSSQAQDHLEDYEDEQFLIKERLKYKDLLWSKYKQYINLKQKNQVLQQKLELEKIFLFKKKLQKSYYKRQQDDLQEQNSRQKEKLKKLTSQFLIRDEKLAKKIMDLQQENYKLQKQKEALLMKIKEYQEQMPKIQLKSSQSKKNLNFLKEFLTSKNYQPLEQFID